jgi:hypothetical protein
MSHNKNSSAALLQIILRMYWNAAGLGTSWCIVNKNIDYYQ